MSPSYRKHFIALESNPSVFNELALLLGASPHLAFEDVFTIDEPILLPHPTLALILVFPTTDVYEAQKADAEYDRAEYDGRGYVEPVVWFRQTINNACGLYAVLHALSNGGARTLVEHGSLLDRLLARCIPLAPGDRTVVLENSAELEDAYRTVALKGDSAVPVNAEDELDFHYICLVKSDKNSHLYELDGDCKGPTDTGVVLETDEDLCSAKALVVVRRYLEAGGENVGFSLMALVDQSGRAG